MRRLLVFKDTAYGAKAGGGTIANLGEVDQLALLRRHIVTTLKGKEEFIELIYDPDKGVPWGRMIATIITLLPEHIDDKRQFAHDSIPQVLTELFGNQGDGWETFKNNKNVTYIKANKM